MELKKQPESELEYWIAIESLGGYVWWMNHDLADGRIEDPDGKIDKSITETQALIGRLVSELGEKFGVIAPQDCPKTKLGEAAPPPPEGKKYYWVWYTAMKDLFYRMEYEKMVCSACPLSKGVDEMITLGGHVPCAVLRGSLYRLATPYLCGMLGWCDSWDEKTLREEIVKKGGEAAYVAFRIKEAGLRALFDRKAKDVVIPG